MRLFLSYGSNEITHSTWRITLFYMLKWGEGPVTAHKSVSLGQRRPRSRGEPNSRPASAWRRRRASVSNQVGRPDHVQCAHPQLVATPPAPVLASGTIGVGWVGRGRSRGASASGSSCVASQVRRHRLGRHEPSSLHPTASISLLRCLGCDGKRERRLRSELRLLGCLPCSACSAVCCVCVCSVALALLLAVFV